MATDCPAARRKPAMCRCLGVLAAALALMTAPIAPAQVEVGNGGDAVVCRSAPDSPFAGHYSLDYLLTWGGAFGPQTAAAVASWPDSAERLVSLLAAKAPQLLSSFHDFRLLVKNQDDYLQRRVWEPAPFGLIDLKDEQMVALVPANCRENDRVQIIQAVIRQPPESSGADGRLIYRFVPETVTRMEATAPLQLSFLYVHEWLWDLSANVDRNRRINAFLHSSKAADLSADMFQQQLRGMGLPLPLTDGAIDLKCRHTGDGSTLKARIVHDFSPRTKAHLVFREELAGGGTGPLKTADLAYHGPSPMPSDGLMRGEVAGCNDVVMIKKTAAATYRLGWSKVDVDHIDDYTCQRN